MKAAADAAAAADDDDCVDVVGPPGDKGEPGTPVSNHLHSSCNYANCKPVLRNCDTQHQNTDGF